MAWFLVAEYMCILVNGYSIIHLTRPLLLAS